MTGMSSPQVLVSGTEDLVSLPEVYFRVKALVHDPEAGVSDFADVISCDPGLSARFLRVAKSNPATLFVPEFVTVRWQSSAGRDRFVRNNSGF